MANRNGALYKRSQSRDAAQYRMQRMRARALTPVGNPRDDAMTPNASLDCGWGRLLFGQTFSTNEALVKALQDEAIGERDIAFYIRDPHVVLAAAPTELFLDPSHTYRLDFSNFHGGHRVPAGLFMRRLSGTSDIEAINRIYRSRKMVPVPPEFAEQCREGRILTVFLAEDEDTGEIVGTAMGIDHRRAFNDPERGASLWCLAVDPQALKSGIGRALTRHLAAHYKARGCQHLDLSVLHDNDDAIRLYERLGFKRIPVFAVKRKNPINEKLFVGPSPEADLNPYARLIVDEALRRGIQVEVTHASAGFFRLTHGGRTVRCRESLSDLTSGVAVSVCDDKAVTRAVVERVGVKVPQQVSADDPDAIAALLGKVGSVVVKPARGEQGQGIAVGLTSMAEIDKAIKEARAFSQSVLVEAMAEGEDLRLVVIDYKVVAAAIRRPATVVGDGKSTVAELIEQHTRRRMAATGGESKVPLDSETERALARADVDYQTVLAEGRTLAVRRTANLHTGGTIHDVTDFVHPALVSAACKAARAIEIPVTGIDLIVTGADRPEYAFIEANERPGLANHEPQPTAERFIDLLFPQSMPHAAREALLGARA